MSDVTADFVETSEISVEATAEGIITRDPGASFAPILMGLACGALFSGVLVEQAIRWIPDLKRDKRNVRFVIWCALTLLIVSEVLNWAWCLHVFVFDRTYSEFVSWRWTGWMGMLDMTILTFIRTFYAERAYKLSGRNKWILSGIMLSTAQKPFSYLCPLGCIAADVLIATTIGYTLWSQRTGWSRTDQMLRNLIFTSAEAHIAGLTIAVIYFIFAIIDKDHPFVLVFLLVIYPKPYMICTMAVVNQRHKAERERSVEVFMTDLNKFPSSFGGSANAQATVAIPDSEDDNEDKHDLPTVNRVYSPGQVLPQHSLSSLRQHDKAADHLYRSTTRSATDSMLSLSDVLAKGP